MITVAAAAAAAATAATTVGTTAICRAHQQRLQQHGERGEQPASCTVRGLKEELSRLKNGQCAARMTGLSTTARSDALRGGHCMGTMPKAQHCSSRYQWRTSARLCLRGPSVEVTICSCHVQSRCCHLGSPLCRYLAMDPGDLSWSAGSGLRRSCAESSLELYRVRPRL